MPCFSFEIFEVPMFACFNVLWMKSYSLQFNDQEMGHGGC